MTQPRFGDYTLLGQLGAGGMGTVFRARRAGQSFEVALKRPQATGGLTPRALARFEREGRLTAALRHPHILPVHAAGVVDGCPFLAYQLIAAARTLDETLTRGPLRGRVEALRDVARALAYAHAQGVVHRDVKPANVLVDEHGHVWLADFGLATAIGEDRLTRTGAMLGTPHYLAPEGFVGQLEAPADVYALGVMLYEALTDQHPFAGQGLNALVAPEQRRIRPPTSVSPQAPADLAALSLAALAADAGERPSADAVASALERWLGGQTAWRTGSPRRALWAGVPLLLAALGLGAWAASPGGGEPPRDPAAQLDDLLRTGERALRRGERAQAVQALAQLAEARPADRELRPRWRAHQAALAARLAVDADDPDQAAEAYFDLVDEHELLATQPELRGVLVELALRAGRAADAAEHLVPQTPGGLRARVYVALERWDDLAACVADVEDAALRARCRLQLGLAWLERSPLEAVEPLTQGAAGLTLDDPLRARAGSAVGAAIDVRQREFLAVYKRGTDERTSALFRELVALWTVGRRLGLEPTRAELDPLLDYCVGSGPLLTREDNLAYLELDPENLLALGAYMYRFKNRGDAQVDLPIFRRAVEVIFASGQVVAEALRAHADLLVHLKRLDELEALIARVDRQFPDSVTLRANLRATLAAELASPQARLELARRALALDPGAGSARAQLVQARYDLLAPGEVPPEDQLEQARAFVVAAVGRDRRILLSLSYRLEARAGNFAAAVRCCREQIELEDPFHLGVDLILRPLWFAAQLPVSEREEGTRAMLDETARRLQELREVRAARGAGASSTVRRAQRVERELLPELRRLQARGDYAALAASCLAEIERR